MYFGRFAYLAYSALVVIGMFAAHWGFVFGANIVELPPVVLGLMYSTYPGTGVFVKENSQTVAIAWFRRVCSLVR